MLALIKDHISTRPWRKLSAAVFAAAAAVLLVATGASAAAPQPAQLPGDFPAPGTHFRLPMRVEGWTLDIVDDPSPSSTGEQEEDSPIPWVPKKALKGQFDYGVGEYEQLAGPSIPIEVLGFRLESEPDSCGDNPNGTAPPEQSAPSYLFELDTQGDAPVSMLKPNQQGQGGWEQSMTLDFKVTITNPPADLARAAEGEQSEPLVLTTKDPAVLSGNLSSFPPQGEVYQLQNPIELVLPEDPEATVATIDKFPVQIGGI